MNADPTDLQGYGRSPAPTSPTEYSLAVKRTKTWIIVCLLVGSIVALGGLATVGVLFYSWSARPGYDEAEFFSTAMDASGRKVPDGPVTRESGDGVLLCEGKYTLGVRDGTWRYFNRQGEMTAEETWSRGLLLSCEGEPFTTYGGFGFSSASLMLSVDSIQPALTVYVVFEPVLMHPGNRMTPTTDDIYRNAVIDAVEQFVRERGASATISRCSQSPMLQELGLSDIATKLTPRIVRVVVAESGHQRPDRH